MFRSKNAVLGFFTAIALAATPLAPAMARGHDDHGWGHGGGWGHERDFRHHGGDGLLFGLLGAGAAVLGAAAYVATAPVRLVADAAAPGPVYAQSGDYPAPGYYNAPAPVYAAPTYAYPTYGYYRPHRVVYAYPAPAYGYPAPVYGAYPGY